MISSQRIADLEEQTSSDPETEALRQATISSLLEELARVFDDPTYQPASALLDSSTDADREIERRRAEDRQERRVDLVDDANDGNTSAHGLRTHGSSSSVAGAAGVYLPTYEEAEG